MPDILIDTDNPSALDAHLQRLGAIIVAGPEGKGPYEQRDGHYVVRGGDRAKVVEIIERHGLGKVVR